MHNDMPWMPNKSNIENGRKLSVSVQERCAVININRNQNEKEGNKRSERKQEKKRENNNMTIGSRRFATASSAVSSPFGYHCFYKRRHSRIKLNTHKFDFFFSAHFTATIVCTPAEVSTKFGCCAIADSSMLEFIAPHPRSSIQWQYRERRHSE